MATDAVQVVSPDQCAAVMLEKPGHGLLCSESPAKTGSSDRAQIYEVIEVLCGLPADLNLGAAGGRPPKDAVLP